MATPSQTDIDKKLAALQRVFKSMLPNKVAEIESLWNLLLLNEEDSTLITCHRMTHTLVGTAGTFGAMVVSTTARELEHILNLLIKNKNYSDENKLKIAELIANIKDASDVWQPTKAAYLPPLEIKAETARKGNLIYLVEDDELIVKELIIQFKKDNFEIKHFSVLTDFITACSIEIPSAIIMGVMFEDGKLAGADTIVRLKKENAIFPPVVFISERFDIEVRLAAANAGAQRFFSKPLKYEKISKTVDGLIERVITKPFRVLIVDDDPELLKYFKIVLSGADMDVNTVSDPLQTLKVLEDFKPDVIVLDVYMPVCSGTEIAKVIRQDDRWALTPIMFLSTEDDINVQLDAMSEGGESFMVKPVTADQLVSAVTAKAKKSRWNYRIYNDLKVISRESEFQTITFNSHNIVSAADVTGKIISVNDNFCKISGYSAEELIGKNHRLIKSENHPGLFYKNMWKTISAGKVWRDTICNINKNGEEYWVDSTIVPFLDEKGHPYKYVSARTDVTELFKSKSRLERSQKFANIGTWDWNIETGDLFWSEHIWKLFGLDAEFIETSYENFMGAIHPDDRELVSNAITSCIEDMTDFNVEHRVVWQDGGVHWLSESGNVVRDKNNKALHMLGVVRDITESKKAEEALIVAHQDAEGANRAKSQFLSSMSHELRTPMNAIMGFGQLLSIDAALNDNHKKSVNEILQASDHLLELINEVLDLSKIESGQIDLTIETVPLGEVITECLQLIYPLAEKRGISITILRDNTEISLSDLLVAQDAVRGDHTRVKQVIINLLSNAVKYNITGGKITIKCDHSNNKVRISIVDTGAGLNKEQKNKLFTSFDRLGAENSDIEGTGIGLVITKNIVELMGGRIGVETEKGTGSTFWFELPGDEQLLTNDIKNNSSTNININAAYSVLYIEDNPANLRLVTQVLSHFPNIHMWSAHEAILGIELSLEHNPDLILLDINLPGMDGYETLKILKKNVLTQSTPVIAISANAMKNDIDKGLAAGFNEYITKPIDISRLMKLMEEKVNKKLL